MPNNDENRRGKDGKLIGKRAITSAVNGLKGGGQSKFDYDSDEFYDTIFQLATRGADIPQIAAMLTNKFPELHLTEQDFRNMVNGQYENWSVEENEKRGSRLAFALTRAKEQINFSIKNKLLLLAMGGEKVKRTTRTRRKLRIDGQYTDDEEISTMETEDELPPNQSAINLWLYHNDPTWRRVTRNIIPEDDEYAAKYRAELGEAGGINTNIDKGVDIGAWIEKECMVASGMESETQRQESAEGDEM